MDTVISMNIIRRAGVFIAAAVVVSLAAVAVSGCGGATTATGTTTNGLEKKSAADVLQAAAAALSAAKSVHVVATVPGAHLDVRMQGGSAPARSRRPACGSGLRSSAALATSRPIGRD